MARTYSAEEVAKAVLDRCREIAMEKKEQADKKKMKKESKLKVFLDKKCMKCGATEKAEENKAIGLSAPIDPMGVNQKVKEPAADEAPPKPKAATTLKSFMAKRKK
jgi:hypothetical protein